MFRTALVVLATVSLSASAAHAAGGQIKGTIKASGKAPAAKPIDMQTDPFCAGKSNKEEDLLVGSNGGLKNAIVRIAKGAPAAPAPTGEVVLDQDGCAYKPHVAVAQAGQVVLIKNSDETLHNVHTYKGPATLFNAAQPQGAPPLKKKFPAPGDVVKFKCDVHPWMTGYVAVTDNPYHAVSGADGSFTIDNVPPGTYTLEVWHEKLGTTTTEVKVADGKPASVNVTLPIK